MKILRRLLLMCFFLLSLDCFLSCKNLYDSNRIKINEETNLEEIYLAIRDSIQLPQSFSEFKNFYENGPYGGLFRRWNLYCSMTRKIKSIPFGFNQFNKLFLNPNDSNYLLPGIDRIKEIKESFRFNSLESGDQPYTQYFGEIKRGNRCMIEFENREKKDYIIIVKDLNDNYANHAYVAANNTVGIYVPNGEYKIYMYKGKGWNPQKEVGNLIGGFEFEEEMKYDGPIKLINSYIKYSTNRAQGNFKPGTTNISEVMR